MGAILFEDVIVCLFLDVIVFVEIVVVAVVDIIVVVVVDAAVVVVPTYGFEVREQRSRSSRGISKYICDEGSHIQGYEINVLSEAMSQINLLKYQNEN